MKKLLGLTLSLFLVSGTALADTPKDAAPQPAKAAQPAKPGAAKKADKSDSAVAAEIDELRQALQSQQEQLQLLKEELAKRDRQIDEAREAAAAANARAAEASSKTTEAVNTTAEVKATTSASISTAQTQESDLVAKVGKVQSEAAATKKELEGKIKGIGPFTFSGDFRLRDEPFIGGPTNQSQVRNRERFRLRFNVNAKLNDDISGGFSVASGDLNDPISTNQTTNQFYTRKPFAIDRAFVNYTPHQLKPLLLTGGKFAYPWYRTELTWDNDLNPEGLAQTLQWNFESTPVLKKLALVGFELPFTEVAGQAPSVNRSTVQSAVYGGQLQSVWQLADWLKLSAYGGFYNYHNADPIALAVAQANAKNPQSPLNGLLPLAGFSLQNSVTTLTKNTIVTADVNGVPAALPTGVTTIQSAQFASKFGLFDGIARFDIKTAYLRLPLVVLGDYVQNTRACANVGNIPTAAPLPTSTATFTLKNSVSGNTTTVCNSRERRGYWLEGRVGRLSEVGDAQFSYTRMFIEREAVMGAFNFSDLRQNSNVSQHRLEVFYQGYKNVQLGFTGLFGRPLNWNNPAPTNPEPLLKRLQFDVIYKF